MCTCLLNVSASANTPVVDFADVCVFGQDIAPLNAPMYANLSRFASVCLECLVSSPRQAGHGTAVSVGFRSERFVDVRDYVGEKYRCERGSEVFTPFAGLVPKIYPQLP